jgi:hypothetical protein
MQASDGRVSCKSTWCVKGYVAIYFIILQKIIAQVYCYLLTLVHRSWISYTLNMEAIRSSETSVNKISTRRHIQEDGILHNHRRENLKSHEIIAITPKSCIVNK